MSQDEDDRWMDDDEFAVNVGAAGGPEVAGDDGAADDTDIATDEVVDVDDLDGDVDDVDLVPTGDYRVDVALSRLRELDGMPVSEHVAVFEDVHAQLRGAMAELDER